MLTIFFENYVNQLNILSAGYSLYIIVYLHSFTYIACPKLRHQEMSFQSILNPKTWSSNCRAVEQRPFPSSCWCHCHIFLTARPFIGCVWTTVWIHHFQLVHSCASKLDSWPSSKVLKENLQETVFCSLQAIVQNSGHPILGAKIPSFALQWNMARQHIAREDKTRPSLSCSASLSRSSLNNLGSKQQSS